MLMIRMIVITVMTEWSTVMLQLIFFRTWMATVPSTLSGLNASLLVRDPKTKRLRVNYDPRIREMLHEAEYLMKLNLEIGSLALNLCMDEDRLKTTNDKSVHCTPSQEIKTKNSEIRRVRTVVLKK